MNCRTVLVSSLLMLAACGANEAGLPADGHLKRAPDAPSSVVFVRSAFQPERLEQLAASSTVIVEGDVTGVSYGPVVGGLGFLDVTIKTHEAMKGAEPGQLISFLMTGYHPESRAVQTVDETHSLAIGDHGIWYLWPADLNEHPEALYVATFSGQMLRDPDGRAVTGSQEPLAIRVCGMAWTDLREAVVRSVAESNDGDRLQHWATTTTNEPLPDLGPEDGSKNDPPPEEINQCAPPSAASDQEESE